MYGIQSTRYGIQSVVHGMQSMVHGIGYVVYGIQSVMYGTGYYASDHPSLLSERCVAALVQWDKAKGSRLLEPLRS